MCERCIEILTRTPTAQSDYDEFLLLLGELLALLANPEKDLLLNEIADGQTTRLTFEKLLAQFPNITPEIRINLSDFSRAKTNAFLKAAQSLSRSLSGVEAEIAELHKMHYLHFMAVEQEHTRQVSQARQNWADIEQFPDASKYLTYHTAGDDRVREQHRLWANITLPSKHPWWNTHYPPNGYNCRCWVTADFEADTERSRSAAELEALPKPDPGFDVNWGKTDYAFPPDHPYFKTKPFVMLTKEASKQKL